MEKRIKEIINGVAIETDEGFLIRDMDIVAKRIAEEFQKEKLGVEFISYDGAYPNLCCGTLILKIY